MRHEALGETLAHGLCAVLPEPIAIVLRRTVYGTCARIRPTVTDPGFFEQPILNSPYENPIPPLGARRERAASEQDSPRAAQGRFHHADSEAEEAPGGALPDPAPWRVTPETVRLLQHWRSDRFGDIRSFFYQVEAVETAIWLTEVAPQLRTEGRQVLGQLEQAREEANPGLAGLALKLATGAGKTTVMAMIIAWQTVKTPSAGRSAGASRGAGRVKLQREWLSRHGLTASECRVIQVLGESLEPTLAGVYTILPNQARRRRKVSRIIVVRTDDALVVKRAGNDLACAWGLVSDNYNKPVWPPVPRCVDAPVTGETKWPACPAHSSVKAGPGRIPDRLTPTDPIRTLLHRLTRTCATN